MIIFFSVIKLELFCSIALSSYKYLINSVLLKCKFLKFLHSVCTFALSKCKKKSQSQKINFKKTGFSLIYFIENQFIILRKCKSSKNKAKFNKFITIEAPLAYITE